MPEHPGRLADKVCVITGAAGAIGAAVAGRLEREGATVAGVDQRGHGVGALSLQADLTDEEQVRQVFARIRDALGRIDVLYNNAGLSDRSDHSALDLPLETWDRVLAANLTTAFLCCKHGIPHLLANDPPGGSVINTASFLAGMGAARVRDAGRAGRHGRVPGQRRRRLRHGRRLPGRRGHPGRVHRAVLRRRRSGGGT
jgi:NAD(P)-dependent dehydrogenase (short-subunit alcohol dehydrogenase family)